MSSGCAAWTTSNGPGTSRSTRGMPARCHHQFSTRTGTRRSCTVIAGRVGGQLRVGAVLPRAREQVQPWPWRGGAGQRRGQFVDVLADTGTVAQGGAVVEQDMHLPEG